MKRLFIVFAFALCLPSFATEVGACDGNYFHIDDFSGLPVAFAPLQGTKSLWCGTTFAPGPSTCGQSGYGHYWDECWESCEFQVTGDMTFEFDIAYDTEPGYDFVYAQYLNSTNTWVTLATYTWDNTVSESFLLPSVLLGPTVRFRFLFQSDGAVDNYDCLSLVQAGACIIDNVAVKQGATVLNFQDFEAEPLGAQQTLDGVWVAGPHPGCGPVRVEESTWGRIKSLYR